MRGKKGVIDLSEAIVKMEQITKRFPGVLALDHCHLEVRKGEVLGLVGENGAGKTTLMRIICGILRPPSPFFPGTQVCPAWNCSRTQPLEPAGRFSPWTTHHMDS